MKKGLLILLAVLLLIALGKYIYTKFLVKPKIQIDLFTNKILTEQKIYYSVDYSGVKFSGVYDLKNKNIQEESAGGYKIKTFQNGLIFGLQVTKNNEVQQSVSYDIIKQKLTLNL